MKIGRKIGKRAKEDENKEDKLYFSFTEGLN